MRHGFARRGLVSVVPTFSHSSKVSLTHLLVDKRMDWRVLLGKVRGAQHQYNLIYILVVAIPNRRKRVVQSSFSLTFLCHKVDPYSIPPVEFKCMMQMAI